MPLAGVMDDYSFRAANLLTSNSIDDAVLEMTLTGPKVLFPGRMQIAITGADMTPSINGQQIDMWKSIIVSRGDLLTFGSLKSGVRTYLSIAGGILEKVVMGSRSTYIRGRIGGHQGRKLYPGDLIPVNPGFTLFKKEVVFPISHIPKWHSERTLRILPGIDFEKFTDSAKEVLTKSEFKVTHNSDRMGIRLSGERITHKDKADVISYPVSPGTIQIPGDGQAVIMLSDCQTVGGYTQIANIISADIFKTGQLKSGDSIRFIIVSNEEARSALIEQNRKLCSIFE